MQPEDFHLSFLVPKSPEQVFDSINDVRTWWSEDFSGASTNAGDVFSVRFADVHYSRQRVTEAISGKSIVWLVTDSRLTFLKNESEWTGTRIGFSLAGEDGGTRIGFTHFGLTPSIECFRDCSGGWTHYLLQSLVPFITSGKANPNVLDKEVTEKSRKR